MWFASLGLWVTFLHEGPLAEVGEEVADCLFFYGSLQDQSLLIDLLDLKHSFHLRPAYIKGYNLISG
jgi:hypothetical protein